MPNKWNKIFQSVRAKTYDDADEENFITDSSDDEEEDEEFYDYDIISKGVIETDEDGKIIPEDINFVVSSYLKRKAKPPNFPLLQCFGDEATDEMTEEESLKYHKEKLQSLTEIYKSQFRRLYDSLSTAHKKFKLDHRQYLLKKRQEQGNPNVSTYTLSVSQPTSDPSPATPLPDSSTTNTTTTPNSVSTPSNTSTGTTTTENSSAEKEFDKMYKHSSIMREIKQKNSVFSSEKANRAAFEQESSFTAVSFEFFEILLNVTFKSLWRQKGNQKI